MQFVCLRVSGSFRFAVIVCLVEISVSGEACCLNVLSDFSNVFEILNQDGRCDQRFPNW